MAIEIISREEARAQGFKLFYTGVPCKNGHLAPRRLGKGRAQPCVQCVSEYHEKWYDKNRERKRAQNAANKAADPEKAKAINRASALKWRAKNLEKARETARRWYADPENRRIHRNARRKRENDGGQAADAADLRAILTAQGHRCAYCKADLKRKKRHLDHIMPLALGGSNDRTNLQYLCVPCNLAKGAKDPIDFAQSRGLLL